tara:strand:- start:347 stop:850 length:504 start_codon:yes stop_codon:yes gene_type:complete
MGAGIGWARIRSLVNENQNQIKILKGEMIHVDDTATTLTAAQSGATVFWTHASAHNVTLPAATAGMSFKFVLSAGSAHAHYILSQTDDEIYGKARVVSTTSDQFAVQVVLEGSAVDKIHLRKAGNAALGGDAGDTVELTCVEDGLWVCNADLVTTHANPASIAVLTD